MKNLIVGILFLCAFQSFGQITLEHTYSDPNLTTLIRTGADEFYYMGYTIPFTDTSFTIFNMNHSVNQTIHLPGNPSGFELYDFVEHLSTVLFDADPDFEYVIFYKDNINGVYKGIVYNEDGSVLFDLGPAYYSYVYNAGSNGVKLITFTHTSPAFLETRVFSLPGTYFPLGINKNGMAEDELQPAYPNPSSDIITLPYQLPIGQKYGQLNVYNSLGQLVESYKVDGTFNSILFDSSPYPAGQYYYLLQSGGHPSATNKFMIVK